MLPCTRNTRGHLTLPKLKWSNSSLSLNKCHFTTSNFVFTTLTANKCPNDVSQIDRNRMKYKQLTFFLRIQLCDGKTRRNGEFRFEWKSSCLRISSKPFNYRQSRRSELTVHTSTPRQPSTASRPSPLCSSPIRALLFNLQTSLNRKSNQRNSAVLRNKWWNGISHQRRPTTGGASIEMRISQYCWVKSNESGSLNGFIVNDVRCG